MINNIFKALFLIVFICFTFILYGIYRNMVDNHFIYTDNRIIDKRTNIEYFWEQYHGYGYFTDDGKYKYVKSLPK